MKNILFITTFLVLIALTSEVMAISKPAPKPSLDAPASSTPSTAVTKEKEKFVGVVENINKKKKMIKVKGKIANKKSTMSFMIDNKTKIIKDHTILNFSDLKKNMAVSLTYRREMDKLTAVLIELLAPQKALKKTRP